MYATLPLILICMLVGLPDSRMSELIAIRTVLLVLSIVGILIKLVQLLYQKLQYFRNLHNYMEVILYTIVILFIQVDPDECWCAGRTLWQLGVAGCVLAWLNLVLILKRLPFTAIPINMMINVISTFFSIVLLPILLIVTFALPFYMLLANPVGHYNYVFKYYTTMQCTLLYSTNLNFEGQNFHG